jgi:flagellar motility protein MotE (MotC chaperone)
MRSIENALTSDRREGIIKGSIIPSFSKCLKTALGAGAIAVVADPTTACIALLGALAGSRYLNNRERMLLLDEIEVELKVVEKEIQKAEQDDDMEKYRKLLTYQKKLRKEDFKLRYKLSRKMGKDYITKSNRGDDD